ncbi:M48 family metalloprotease [Novipirellula aureliae]|nr:M48 family metalloprotease [Novipirellula aureliae]
MHLQSFLLIVVSLSCGSLPQGDVDLPRAIGASMGMITAWWLLCHIAARTTANYVLADQIEPLEGARYLEKQLDIFRWLGLGVIVMCLGGFGLARGIDSVPILTDSMLLQSIALLTPAVLLAAASWSAEHRYGVRMGYVDSGIGEHWSAISGAFRSGMAWLIVPIGFLLGVADFVGQLPIQTGTANSILAITSLLFLCAGLPWIVSRLFKTEALDTATNEWVTSLLENSGLRRTKVARWNTSGRAFNAVIIGFLPPIRTMLISDRLQDELSRTQIAMVVLHEAAHLRRRHVPLRMLAILPAWGFGALVTHVAGEASWATAAGSAAGLLMTLIVLRMVAYRTELDADLQACRMAVAIAPLVDDVPTTYDDAATTLGLALLRVTEEHPQNRRRTWLHPGVDERIEFMRRNCQAEIKNSTTAGTIANPA